MITIDGTSYDIPVLSMTRRADFLDKYAERTEDGVLHRELIGVYFNYQVKFGRSNDTAVYAALWNKLTEPEEFHSVTVPDESGDFEMTFQAYFSNVTDEIRRVTPEAAFFKNLTVNFTAKSPART